MPDIWHLTGSQPDKGIVKNSLEDIPGIGEKTATQLLQHFKSVTKIKLASEKDIASQIGVAKAKVVINYFTNQHQV